MALSIIILAAGQSKRMHSKVPKVLHQLGGKPLLYHVLTSAAALSPQDIYLIHGHQGALVQKTFEDHKVTWVLQDEQLGTGHAVLQALPFIKDDHQVLILYGDVPLINHKTLQKLLTIAKDGIGIVTANLKNPQGYGRIVRNNYGNILSIIEHKDATAEQLAIREINSGILTTTSQNLKKWLPQLATKNLQHEYYLTDIINLAFLDGLTIEGIMADASEIRGVNTRLELARLERRYQEKIANKLLAQGVSLADPKRFDVRGELIVKNDVYIDINVIIEGRVIIGENCRIGANTILRNVEIADNVLIKDNCLIEGAKIKSGCIVGPFARIRPQTILEENVHIGNFVEVKNSHIANNSKANHLSYLGDALLGKNVNVGAGTITCNYDGANKHQTVIKDGAFIGSASQLIAPVIIGKNATLGAGSTITFDVPDDTLALSRVKQKTISGWKRPKRINNKDDMA